MKKILLTATSLLLINFLFAQQKEGKILYERTIQMQVHINDDDAMAQMLPKTRTDKFELTFANNQSLWKHVDEDDNADEISGGNGVQIKMMTPGQNDIVFSDFSNAKQVSQKEIFDKKFIVTDSILKLNWKLTGETKTILNHICQQAIAQKTGKRIQMNIDNGKMEKKEIDDTSNMVAWFTTDIPVSAGPEVQGQLPGLILALDMNNGRMVYKATGIATTADIASIKEPSKGKKVTPAEFKTEQQKLMEEMQKNNGGNGNMRIRIQN